MKSSLNRWTMCGMNALCVFILITPMITVGGNGTQLPAVIDVGNFSAGKNPGPLPIGWEPLYFKGIESHTSYELVRDDGTTVVKAVANASASGLVREIRINPEEYPIVRWQWKVMKILEKSDIHQKAGDDYPARVYITFEYDSSKVSFFEKIKYQIIKLLYGRYPPLSAINYIWASKAPKGLIVPNPYTDKAMMFVVESGEENLDQWVGEERNIYEDYKEAFNEDPPMISGVAIMTDTDNTGESAIAYYGNILFKKAQGGGTSNLTE